MGQGKGLGHGDWHGQQHGAFVAIVGQGADRDLVRNGPGDVARIQPGGQLPGQLGGQAGVARVLPVGVPVGLVGDLQAQPQRLARAHALRRVGDQLGLHMGVVTVLLPGLVGLGLNWALALIPKALEAIKRESDCKAVEQA